MIAPPSIRSAADSRLGGLLRDLTAGLKQQMFYWGKDVVHPSGNLLVARGFTKTRSMGLQGTSCYGLAWQGGRIELHGACAGWYGPEGGFVFVRPHGKCHVWTGGAPPVPGEWPADRFESAGARRLHGMARPFLDWWLWHERLTEELLGPSYRIACHRHFRKLPKSRPWLEPAAAERWLRRFRDDPAGLERARRFDA